MTPLFGIGLVLPVVVDGTCQYGFKKESTNRRRFITGLLAGIGTGILV